MAIFKSREEKEDKQKEKLLAMMQHYGLTEMPIEDQRTVAEIKKDLMGLGLFKAGMALSFAKGEEQAKVGYLQALVKQNWLIIKKLSEISNALNKEKPL